MKIHFLLIITLTVFFLACSPRVGTIITKTYPAKGNDEPVKIIMQTNEVPALSESLGVASVTDTGFSTQCDSLSVVELLKKEARKVGGNAVVITEYVKPSFWGSSCHQMTGTILRIHDDSDAIAMLTDADSAQLATIKVLKPERKLPQMNFAANLGYGWRTAPLAPKMNEYEKKYYKGLTSGFVWDASFNYYFNDYYGIGFVYSAYNANQYMYVSLTNEYDQSYKEGFLKTKDLIYFIGPAFLLRLPIPDEKWVLTCNLGLGYLHYTTTTSELIYSKQYGETVGAFTTLGVEHKVNKNWTVGVNCSSVSGVLNKVTVEYDGYKSTKDISNAKEGLQQFQLSVGLRYYIK